MSTISLTPSFFTSPSFYPESSLDTKARLEYDRDRSKAHRGHDGRKKFSTSSTPPTPKRTGLGHGNAWKNSIITLDDMEDLSREFVESSVVEDESTSSLGLFNKENSKPSPRVTSVSLEELVRSSKNRKSQSRISLSRQASMENIIDSFPSLGITSPATSLLPCISESADLSLDPMQPFSLPPFDYDDDDDDASFTSDEFSPPGADDWSMDMAEDGAVRFTNSSDSLSFVSTSSILVESSGW